MSDRLNEERSPDPRAERKQMDRRQLLQLSAGAVVVVAMAGWYFTVADSEETKVARNTPLPDGRPRLPPGQHVIQALKPMGGTEGDPNPGNFRLRVHGLVKKPLELDYAELLKLPQTEQTCDVHCVTTWSMLDSRWTGVQVAHLADLAGVESRARHVIFEANADYTANVPLAEATAPNVLVAHRHMEEPIAVPNGAPVRALVPDLYFWKSAKWLTGIRFVEEDVPGYWEVRGYHNHADPWKEERYG